MTDANAESFGLTKVGVVSLVLRSGTSLLLSRIRYLVCKDQKQFVLYDYAANQVGVARCFTPNFRSYYCALVKSRSSWSEKCFLSVRFRAGGPPVCSPDDLIVSMKSRICSRCFLLFSVYRSPRDVRTKTDFLSTSAASGMSEVMTRSPAETRRSISLSASSKPLGT